VGLDEVKGIESVAVKSMNDMSKEPFIEIFPDMDDLLLSKEQGLDLIVDVTRDINTKTERENKIYEKIFKPKKIIITTALILINVILFFVTYGMSHLNLNAIHLISFGGLYAPLVKSGEVWRLISAGFLHGGIVHLLCNMYSLYIIGTQLENFIGKPKFLILYFVSMISASLMCCVINPNVVSVGASGAIFGLLGALVYFGYHYRIYLGTVLRNQVIPLIILNLMLGFMMSGVDNAAHIGGLIGGLLIAMALGVQKKENKRERLNGCITLTVYLLFLIYIMFFR